MLLNHGNLTKLYLFRSIKGIGAALAMKLASVGSKLILSATRTSNLEDVKAKCLLANSNLSENDVMVLSMDITDIPSHSRNLQLIIKAFGRVDILVNNAGIMETTLFIESDPEIDDKLFSVNFISPVRLARTVAQYWVGNNRKGHLAFTSSLSGKVGLPTLSIYGSTKFALQGLADSIRSELFNKDILVTTVCPGVTSTDLYEVTRNTTTGTKMNKLIPSMTAQRCAELYTVALANEMSESWPSRHPMLMVTYFGTLFPSVYSFMTSRVVTESRLRKMLKGRLPI